MTDRLRFPFMVWAHGEAFRSSYTLSQSGMPAPLGGPAAAWVDEVRSELGREELVGYPTADLQPRLEERLARELGVAPERVLVTTGASAGMFLASQLWFVPGATVAVETPSYEALRALPDLHGARRVPLVRRLADAWRPDPAELDAALAGSRPGHAFVTSPHNPSGAVLDADGTRTLAEAAASHGGVFVSCEIYAEYAPPGTPRAHAALLAPNGVSISGLNKAFGLVGLRIGWMVLGEGLAHERDRLLDLAYLTYGDPPTPSLALALRALDARDTLLAPLREIERTSRPHLERWLTGTDGIEATLAPYGIISFPRIRGIEDTGALAEHLARTADVDVGQGEHFDAPGHLRIACGVPEATLVEGLQRLTDGILTYRESGSR